MTENSPPPPGVAFLLTQLGTHAASRFAERVSAHGLTPPQCGVLRLLHGRDGLSQHQLATVLGMVPSRVVVLVDELERAGFVHRVRDDTDRRRNVLGLTDAGKRMLQAVGRVARAHEVDITQGLTDDERDQLQVLLERMAARAGLVPGVHPGYRTLRPSAARS